jgi:hypothetical protein
MRGAAVGQRGSSRQPVRFAAGLIDGRATRRPSNCCQHGAFMDTAPPGCGATGDWRT